MIQVLYFFRAFYEQLGIKFTAWVEETLSRCWAELKCEHEDVRCNSPCPTSVADVAFHQVLAYFSEILAFCGKIMVSVLFHDRQRSLTLEQWRPNPSLLTAETFVRECRTLPAVVDIMGIRGVFYEERVMELVEQFPVWRKERLPGVRAFQSTYDRCASILQCSCSRLTRIATGLGYSFANGCSSSSTIPTPSRLSIASSH